MDVFPPPSKKQDVGGSDSDSQDSSGDHSGLPGSRRSLKEFWEAPNALARIFGQRCADRVSVCVCLVVCVRVCVFVRNQLRD